MEIMQSHWQTWKDLPIQFTYESPTAELLTELKANAQVVLIESTDRLIVESSYYQAGLKGTRAQCYTRRAVLLRLQAMLTQLDAAIGFSIFDAFRSLETQTVLYQQFREIIKKANPNFTETELETETRLYVSHPSDPSHHAIPLHNSGGAIDLELIACNTGKPWDFGTVIDDPCQQSHTDYFEAPYQPNDQFSEARWYQVRENRRVLFHLMRSVGFINYRHEWWHYDLGDCYWSKELGIPWVFSAMEAEVVAIS